MYKLLQSINQYEKLLALDGVQRGGINIHQLQSDLISHYNRLSSRPIPENMQLLADAIYKHTHIIVNDFSQVHDKIIHKHNDRILLNMAIDNHSTSILFCKFADESVWNISLFNSGYGNDPHPRIQNYIIQGHISKDISEETLLQRLADISNNIFDIKRDAYYHIYYYLISMLFIEDNMLNQFLPYDIIDGAKDIPRQPFYIDDIQGLIRDQWTHCEAQTSGDCGARAIYYQLKPILALHQRKKCIMEGFDDVDQGGIMQLFNQFIELSRGVVLDVYCDSALEQAKQIEYIRGDYTHHSVAQLSSLFTIIEMQCSSMTLKQDNIIDKCKEGQQLLVKKDLKYNKYQYQYNKNAAAIVADPGIETPTIEHIFEYITEQLNKYQYINDASLLFRINYHVNNMVLRLDLNQLQTQEGAKYYASEKSSFLNTDIMHSDSGNEYINNWRSIQKCADNITTIFQKVNEIYGDYIVDVQKINLYMTAKLLAMLLYQKLQPLIIAGSQTKKIDIPFAYIPTDYNQHMYYLAVKNNILARFKFEYSEVLVQNININHSDFSANEQALINNIIAANANKNIYEQAIIKIFIHCAFTRDSLNNIIDKINEANENACDNLLLCVMGNYQKHLEASHDELQRIEQINKFPGAMLLQNTLMIDKIKGQIKYFIRSNINLLYQFSNTIYPLIDRQDSNIPDMLTQFIKAVYDGNQQLYYGAANRAVYLLLTYFQHHIHINDELLAKICKQFNNKIYFLLSGSSVRGLSKFEQYYRQQLGNTSNTIEEDGCIYMLQYMIQRPPQLEIYAYTNQYMPNILYIGTNIYVKLMNPTMETGAIKLTADHNVDLRDAATIKQVIEDMAELHDQINILTKQKQYNYQITRQGGQMLYILGQYIKCTRDVNGNMIWYLNNIQVAHIDFNKFIANVQGIIHKNLYQIICKLQHVTNKMIILQEGYDYLYLYLIEFDVYFRLNRITRKEIMVHIQGEWYHLNMQTDNYTMSRWVNCSSGLFIIYQDQPVIKYSILHIVGNSTVIYAKDNPLYDANLQQLNLPNLFSGVYIDVINFKLPFLLLESSDNSAMFRLLYNYISNNNMTQTIEMLQYRHILPFGSMKYITEFLEHSPIPFREVFVDIITQKDTIIPPQLRQIFKGSILMQQYALNKGVAYENHQHKNTYRNTRSQYSEIIQGTTTEDCDMSMAIKTLIDPQIHGNTIRQFDCVIDSPIQCSDYNELSIKAPGSLEIYNEIMRNLKIIRDFQPVCILATLFDLMDNDQYKEIANYLVQSTVIQQKLSIPRQTPIPKRLKLLSIFELLFGGRVQENQLKIIDGIIENINQQLTDKNAEKKMYQLIMGQGKTSFIMPYIGFYCTQILKRVAVNVLPDSLVSQSASIILSLFSPLLDKLKIVVCSMVQGNMQYSINGMPGKINSPSVFDNAIIIVSESAIKYAMIKQIQSIVNSNYVYIFDEVDLLADPFTSDFNIVDQESTPPNIAGISAYVWDHVSKNNINISGENEILHKQIAICDGLFKQCSQQIENVDYGIVSVKMTGNIQWAKHNLVAIPYSGFQIPNIKNSFRLYMTQIILTCQYICSKYTGQHSLLDIQIYAYVEHLKNKRQQELIKYKKIFGKSAQRASTDTFKKLAQISEIFKCEESGSRLQIVDYKPKISIEDPLYIQFNKDVFLYICQEFVKYSPTYQNASFVDLVNLNIIKCSIGFTGTPSIYVPKQLQDASKPTHTITKNIIDEQNIIKGLTNDIENNKIQTKHIYIDISARKNQQKKNKVAAKQLLMDLNIQDFTALIDIATLFTQYDQYQYIKYIREICIERQSKQTKYLYIDSNHIIQYITNESNIPQPYQKSDNLENLFIFFDQAHITGQDIKLAANANALIVFGNKNRYRDLAQGAFRMRQLGNTQIIHYCTNVNGLQDKEHIDIQDIQQHIINLAIQNEIQYNSQRDYVGFIQELRTYQKMRSNFQPIYDSQLDTESDIIQELIDNTDSAAIYKERFNKLSTQSAGHVSANTQVQNQQQQQQQQQRQQQKQEAISQKTPAFVYRPGQYPITGSYGYIPYCNNMIKCYVYHDIALGDFYICNSYVLWQHMLFPQINHQYRIYDIHGNLLLDNTTGANYDLKNIKFYYTFLQYKLPIITQNTAFRLFDIIYNQGKYDAEVHNRVRYYVGKYKNYIGAQSCRVSSSENFSYMALVLDDRMKLYQNNYKQFIQDAQQCVTLVVDMIAGNDTRKNASPGVIQLANLIFGQNILDYDSKLLNINANYIIGVCAILHNIFAENCGEKIEIDKIVGGGNFDLVGMSVCLRDMIDSRWSKVPYHYERTVFRQKEGRQLSNDPNATYAQQLQQLSHALFRFDADIQNITQRYAFSDPVPKYCLYNGLDIDENYHSDDTDSWSCDGAMEKMKGYIITGHYNTNKMAQWQ